MRSFLLGGAHMARMTEVREKWRKSVVRQVGSKKKVEYNNSHRSKVSLTLRIPRSVSVPPQLIRALARHMGITDKKAVAALVSKARRATTRALLVTSNCDCFTVIDEKGRRKTVCFVCQNHPPFHCSKSWFC